MNIKQIVAGIYYAGVNDRVTSLFEGLWPIPKGVSYNSYIVAGSEKTALIDTVRIDTVRDFFNNIKGLIGDRKIDYLVVNHMEPDHSGSIPEIVRAYPELKIIGNAQTVGMIKGFYHIDDPDRFLTIKDGEEVSLGDMTLRFYLTPMVHWPETMMTYVPERKTLFSGDAFGCFGALSGAVVDTEMTTDLYFPEMHRYYANIVGKYGMHVQRALKKLAGVEFDYICSTHGPVWHDRIAEVVAVYDRLSKYEPEAGVTIIYGSMYGNTAEAAEEIACGLAEAGVRNIRIHDASHSTMSDMISDAFRYEGLVIGSATYSMTIFPPVAQLMQAMETREIRNKQFAWFGNFTWAPKVVGPAMEAFAEKLKLPVVGSVAVKQSLDDDSRHQARELGHAIAAALTLK